MLHNYEIEHIFILYFKDGKTRTICSVVRELSAGPKALELKRQYHADDVRFTSVFAFGSIGALLMAMEDHGYNGHIELR